MHCRFCARVPWGTIIALNLAAIAVLAVPPAAGAIDFTKIPHCRQNQTPDNNGARKSSAPAGTQCWDGGVQAHVEGNMYNDTANIPFMFTVTADGQVTGKGRAIMVHGPNTAGSCTYSRAQEPDEFDVIVSGRRDGDQFELDFKAATQASYTISVIGGPCTRGSRTSGPYSAFTGALDLPLHPAKVPVDNGVTKWMGRQELEASPGGGMKMNAIIEIQCKRGCACRNGKKAGEPELVYGRWSDKSYQLSEFGQIPVYAQPGGQSFFSVPGSARFITDDQTTRNGEAWYHIKDPIGRPAWIRQSDVLCTRPGAILGAPMRIMPFGENGTSSTVTTTACRG